MRFATKTVTKDKGDRLNLDRFPSAGPHANITGMKQRFWGEDALCIKCGVYLFCVDQQTYNRV